MKKILFLFNFILIVSCQSQTLELKGLPNPELNYVNNLYNLFQERLIKNYGNLKMNELLNLYVKDFSDNKISSSFFAAFSFDTTSLNFHTLFSQSSLQEDNVENGIKKKNNNEIIVIEEVIIDENQKIAPLDNKESEFSYYKFNTKSTFALYLQKMKSENLEINNMVNFIGYDISPVVISSGLKDSFSKKDYNDLKLQIFVMIELFILPKLTDMIK